MSGGEIRAFRAAEQLSAILATSVLPPAARAVAERVQARLSSRVAMGVVGAPGSGKRRIVEGLLGGPVLPAMPGLPPAEITLGMGESMGAILGTGQEISVDLADFAAVDPAELAMIRVTAPLPLLEKMSFTVVPLEGPPQDQLAALAWTFRRSDMLLWCTPRFDGPDRELWHAVPETMRDHAFLALTGSGAARPREGVRTLAAEYFAEARDLSPGEDGQERIARLRSAMLFHVSRARREDLEGALVFLDQHMTAALRADTAPAALCPGRTPQQRGAEAGAGQGALENAAADGTARDRAEEHRSDIAAGAPLGPQDPAAEQGPAEIVDLLAARGRRLAALSGLAQEGDTTAPQETAPSRALMEFCGAALEECAEIARAHGGALADLIDEATELMLLLQLEDGETALADTVALLLQVRRDCEALLAA